MDRNGLPAAASDCRAGTLPRKGRTFASTYAAGQHYQQQATTPSPSVSSSSSYTQINNYGVTAMELGDYTQAIELFRESNRLLKDLIGERQQQQQQQKQQLSQSQAMDVDTSSTPSMHVSIFPDMSHATKDTDYYIDERHGYYIYKNLIKLPTDDEQHQQLLSNHKEHCAAILFNLAVAHHLRGMLYNGTASHRQQQQDLRKSVAFYELCQKVLIKKRIQCGHCIYMAIANNLGIVYTILEGATQAKPFFERLLSIQMLMIEFSKNQLFESSECTSSSSNSNKADSGFLYNTSRILILHDCVAAAA